MALASCATLRSASDYRAMRVPLDDLRWNVVYDGGGEVHFGRGVVRFRPGPVKGDLETKATLLTLREFPSQAIGVRINFRVVRQLRPNPRPWEVFWVFFGYQQGKDVRTKSTDYFILKSNGIELGKAYGELEQEFLMTKDSPRLVIGKRHEIQFLKQARELKIFVDGQFVARSPIDFRMDQLFSSKESDRGTIGLYAEDAEVEVDSVEILHL